MGMFDTFYGEVTCPYCKGIHEFEEQTKSYECLLEEFYLGDYIDKGNTNYIYKFKWFCEHDRDKNFQIGIAIKRGQIVKFLVNSEIEKLENSHLETLENIEDGLGRRLLYEKICKEASGYPKEEINYKLNPLSEGYKFTAFNVEWEVVKLYRQKLGFIFKDMEYFYEIKSKEHGLRIMKSSKNMWNKVNIITLEQANKWKSLYFDE